jgi:hypothetical protein
MMASNSSEMKRTENFGCQAAMLFTDYPSGATPGQGMYQKSNFSERSS